MKTFFGYESIIDFAQSLFGAKSIKLNAIVGGVAGMISLITGYIYDNELAIWTLWALYAADFASGVAAAWHSGTISSTKLPRILLNITAMTLLISISWRMAQSNMMFTYLPGVVIGGAYSTLFVSLLENLSKLEVLPPALHRLIQKRFGLNGILDRLEQDEEDATKGVSPESDKSA